MDGARTPEAPLKDLYEIGEIPPLGHVPARMYAWCIRRERHGPPEEAMQVEVVDVPKPDSHEVLVLVMAAGVGLAANEKSGMAVAMPATNRKPTSAITRIARRFVFMAYSFAGRPQCVGNHRSWMVDELL